jgi:CBS domain-containing protein
MMNVRGEIMRDALAPHPAYTHGGDTHAPRWQARSLPVRDVMSPPPLAIGIDAALSEAHRTMQERSSEHLLVFDEDPVSGEKRLVGVLSDRDLVRHLRPSPTRDESESLRERVFGAVNFAPITVKPESPVSDAAALMLHHSLTCLPVCTPRGRVVGVVTSRDLMHLLIA